MLHAHSTAWVFTGWTCTVRMCTVRASTEWHVFGVHDAKHNQLGNILIMFYHSKEGVQLIMVKRKWVFYHFKPLVDVPTSM
jgi:hypothetical protein